MKKKLVVVLLSAAMCVAAFGGCGAKSDSSDSSSNKKTETSSKKEDQKAADAVAKKIDAIYVQERTDKTDEQCKAAKEAWDKLTDAQRKEMELYIPEEGWKSYTPCISDPVKSYFDDLEGAEKGNFAKLYIRLLVENPEEFLQGAGLQTFGLWYPNKQWPDYRTWHPYIDIMSYDSIYAIMGL